MSETVNPCASECVDVVVTASQCSIGVDGQGTCPSQATTVPAKEGGFPLFPVLGGVGAVGTVTGGVLLSTSGKSTASPSVSPVLGGPSIPNPTPVPLTDNAFVLSGLLCLVGMLRMRYLRR